MSHPPEADASSDEEDEDSGALWDAFKIHGTARAREQLFLLHMGFARNIARRHHREQTYGDLELPDLYQHAYAGLLEALDRFDPALGVPFRPFAAHRISGSVRDGIARMNEMREQISWRRRLRRERMASLSDADLSGDPIEKLAEIAAGLALGFMLEGTGLVSSGESEHGAPAGTAYDSVVWQQMASRLALELAELPEREQGILRQHYLEGLGFDQIAALLGLTKGRISQLHRAALSLLRKRMRGQGHFRMIR